MKKRLMNITRELAPPIVLKIYDYIAGRAVFTGNYATWREARKDSGGYDSDSILNKVKEAMLKVKTGEAVYERDSVLFDKIQYSWALLAGLLWVASRNDNRLNLIDFGGSLGSSYFQNKDWLLHLKELKWNIIEQENFVECGKRFFEDEHLRFFCRIDGCLNEQASDAILLSGVLQYLERPYDLLEEIVNSRIKYILIDRTPFLKGGEERITIQKVPAHIYEASYPCWFFNQSKFVDFFSREYDLIADFLALDQANIPSEFKGYILKRKDVQF